MGFRLQRIEFVTELPSFVGNLRSLVRFLLIWLTAPETYIDKLKEVKNKKNYRNATTFKSFVFNDHQNSVMNQNAFRQFRAKELRS